MTFEGHTFRHNPKKEREDLFYTLYLAGGIVVFLLVFIFLFRGLIGLIILVAAIYALVQLKRNDIKKKGVNRFGSLVDKIVLTKEQLTIGEQVYPIAELEGFDIEANDYQGKPSDFMSYSVGTDNYMEFTHKGVDHYIQFHARRVSDLKILNTLAKELGAIGKK